MTGPSGEPNVGQGEGGFERDPAHWLMKLAPREWIRAGLAELRRAEQAYAQKNARAGLAGARRAAGMALNGALIVEPDARWGRSYVDHLLAVANDARLPARVREGAKRLVDTPLPGQSGPASLIAIRTATGDEKILEAARDLVAHAYAVVVRHEGAAG